jgi:hypothetical protein
MEGQRRIASYMCPSYSSRPAEHSLPSTPADRKPYIVERLPGGCVVYRLFEEVPSETDPRRDTARQPRRPQTGAEAAGSQIDQSISTIRCERRFTMTRSLFTIAKP